LNSFIFVYSSKPIQMKKILFLFLFLTTCLLGYSQKKEISIKEYFADAEFFFMNEEYIDALQDYLEVARQGYSENANINYKIGICYLYMPGQKEKSINYLTKASASVSNNYSGSTLNETTAPLDVFLYLGNAYRVTNNLEKAKETYNHYISLLPEAAKEERNYTNKQIEACNIALEFMSNPVEIKFTNLGTLINTNNSNYNCVISADGSTMVYMTKLPFYEAVFMSKRRGNNWSRPVNITPQIMSDGDQTITGISSDGNTILLVKEDVFDSEIYISYFENGQWSKSKPIGKPINSRFYESHASFGNNNKTIFFASNRAGGVGEMDIYYSQKMENGDWGEPVNIGNDINTNLNEDTPFLSQDGKDLYFSSQGHLNMGGYDFFVAHLSDSGWTNPENLRCPLSTTDDDLFYFPWKNGNPAFVQKILPEGYGSWDIYSTAPIVIEEEKEPIAEEVREATNEPVNEVANVEPKKTEVVAEKPVEKEQPKTVEFEQKPILFGFDASNLAADTKAEIDKYELLLKDNGNITLTIKGFTDNLGPDNYNQMLSERRATGVLNYIVSKGISADRLKSVGLGETQFIASNTNPDGSDNPEGRKYNRRVEFELIGLNQSTIIIRRINIVPEGLQLQEK
jgi:outer membrane protein OmpA-like peptidoglycan-associated protein/tetratricopeptide (TPR) repeat protein